MRLPDHYQLGKNGWFAMWVISTGLLLGMVVALLVSPPGRDHGNGEGWGLIVTLVWCMGWGMFSLWLDGRRSRSVADMHKLLDEYKERDHSEKELRRLESKVKRLCDNYNVTPYQHNTEELLTAAIEEAQFQRDCKRFSIDPKSSGARTVAAIARVKRIEELRDLLDLEDDELEELEDWAKDEFDDELDDDLDLDLSLDDDDLDHQPATSATSTSKTPNP